ncbi:hypothetical protein [uncultured Dysgonomonas sp.]|uniref:Uncharacterized protein n=1 Tax=uncultured Dysgonomonas sp. TaxID=206096 RepID=A0A212ITH2_9BACT|nr:hypothetical protein [uncultured Dysgonomonas sp.]SBV90506.1 hypothetical protein KL86DYS1_10089 [uncultured Dysgonomonas sp.]
MNKENIIEKGLIAAKGIVTMIPVLGGTITSVWSDIEAIQAKRKHERLEEFYIALKEEVERIKDRINTSYINQPDFLDIFELTAKYIVNERNEEKRILFRNILANSITMKDCSYDKTEKYLRVLEQMNSFELLLLKILRNPKVYNDQQGNVIKDPNGGQSNAVLRIHYTLVSEFKKIMSDLTKASQDDISEAIYFLESNRLVRENASESRLQTNGNPIHVLDDKLTSKGKDFMSFILVK